MLREYFRITAPFSSMDEIEPLKKAGADELYCGYVNEELTEKWPLAFLILNRRGEQGSFENYEDFKEAVEKARSHGLDVYVTLNGLYTPEQYPLLDRLVKSIDRLKGVTGLIVADIGFLLFLRKNNFKKEVHISTGGTSLNSHTLNFYKDLGAKRIILDRQLASDEVGEIIIRSKNKIDIELFIIAEPCGGFIDGLCTFFHCFEDLDANTEKISKNAVIRSTYSLGQIGKGCIFYRRILETGNFEVLDASTYKKSAKSLRYIGSKSNSFGCRICDLYDLKDSPIKGLKIVGRGVKQEEKVILVKAVAEALRYLSCKGITRQGYQKKCRDLFSRVILKDKRRCTKFDCYFPSL